VARVAHAGKPVPPAAKAHYKAGYAAYNLGRFAEALKNFEQAAKLVPGNPKLVYSLGKTHLKLEHWRKALFFLRLYISKVPEAKRYDGVLKLIAMLEKTIAKLDTEARRGKLSLKGLPPGAEILIDGKLRAQAPLAEALSLQPGEHSVEVRAAGFAPWKRTLSVRPKSFQTLEVRLELGVTKQGPMARPRSQGWLVAGITTAALALGAEVAAIILTSKANAEFGDSDAYTSKRNAAIAMHVVAGTAAVGSIVSWIFYGRSGREARTRMALIPTASGAQLSASMRF
jgi:tetratricopeptide (TPR) repeat protein